MPKVKAKSPKTYRMLEWDGSLNADGACNKGRPNRPDEPIPDRVLGLAPHDGMELEGNTVVISTAVSVRILACAQVFDLTAHERLLIPIQLKNFHRIQALMLRVYDYRGKVVYQEILTQEEIRDLADADRDAVLADDWDGHTARGAPLAAAARRDLAHTAGSRYRIEVWVSSHPDELEGVEPATDMTGRAVYAQTVHNEYVPQPNEVRDRYYRMLRRRKPLPGNLRAYLPGRRDRKEWDRLIRAKMEEAASEEHRALAKYQPRLVTVLNGRPIYAALDRRRTGAADIHCVNDIGARVADLRQNLEVLDEYLDARNVAAGLPAKGMTSGGVPNTDPHRELRLYLGPEWYFRRGNSVNIYSHSELRDIIEQCRAVSTEHPDWLFSPGTIFFGLGFDQLLADMDLVAFTAARTAVATNFRITKNAGAEALGSVDDPGGVQCWIFGNVLPIFHNGQVIHYLFKRDKGESERDGFEHYAPFFSGQLDLLRWQESSFFTHDDVRFAVDICRDHMVGRALIQHAAQMGVMARRHLAAEANAWDTLRADLNLNPAIGHKYDAEINNVLRETDIAYGLALGAFDGAVAGIEAGWIGAQGFDPAAHPEGVDIHLVTSSEVLRVDSAVVARDAGLFLHCDGGRASADGLLVRRAAPPLGGGDLVLTTLVNQKTAHVSYICGEILSNYCLSSARRVGHAGDANDLITVFQAGVDRAAPFNDAKNAFKGTDVDLHLTDIEDQRFRAHEANEHRVQLYIESLR